MDLDFIDISREQPHRRVNRQQQQTVQQRRQQVPQHRTINSQRRKTAPVRKTCKDQDISIIECNRPINKREAQRIRHLRARRRFFRKVKALCLLFITIGLLLILIKLITNGISGQEIIDVFNKEKSKLTELGNISKPEMTEDYLTLNQYSRPGEAIGKVKNIFVHYTANRGTSASQNRSYFENLAASGETSASAHFIIGYDGEIIQCIPLNEIGYAVVNRNYDSISIECCYLSEDGKFTEATYQSLLKLSRWLLNKYRLSPGDMRRHYDEGGKLCPLYYVEHEDAWLQFIDDLEK